MQSVKLYGESREKRKARHPDETMFETSNEPILLRPPNIPK